MPASVLGEAEVCPEEAMSQTPTDGMPDASDGHISFDDIPGDKKRKRHGYVGESTKKHGLETFVQATVDP